MFGKYNNIQLVRIIMKKYIYSVFLMMLGAVAFTACSEDEGQTPGSDSQPVITLYQYEVSGDYNPDNDCFIRVSANSVTTEAYYLAELTADKEARGLSEADYANYVVENGTKLSDISGASEQDVYITDLHGVYTITVVGVNGGTKTMKSTEFSGLDFKPLGKGLYQSEFFEEAWPVDVEYSEVGNRYRISDCWYEGYGFAFSPKGTNVTVYPSKMETGYVHSKYGMVSVTDTGSTYDEATKTFTFAFKWTVSAGSFGVYNEYLTLE